MDSASTTDAKAMRREGDSHGSLQKATIQSPLSSSTKHHEDTNHDTHHDHDDDDADADEEKEVPSPGSGRCSHEKPLFPSLTPRGAAEPLVLSVGDDATGEKVPYTLNRYLRDYQREGIKFLHHNYTRSRGCILGDDMGLGKTVQVIGFLSAVLHKTGTWEDNKPRFLRSQSCSEEQRRPSKMFLIVAPLSVLYNWKEELDTWGHFRCLVVHGLRKEEELSRIRTSRFEVALTTYETLRLCLDHFNSISWSAVIVDEAHKLKNPKSQITQAMKELKCKVRVGLTGTILQNNLEEFWCVLDWAVPACLGGLGHFKKEYCDPVEKGQQHSATKRALATARRAVRALAAKISPWFLRRTKALIKDQLPQKDDRVVYCALTDFQRSVYQTVLDTEDVTLILRSPDKCDCQSGRSRRSCCYKSNSDGVEVKALYFSYFAILRKVANHAALLQSADGTSKKQKELVGSICQKVFQKFPDFMKRCKQEAFEAMSDPMYSGKMKVLQKLLGHYMKRRDKVLLFSLSTKLLDVLVSYCMAEGLDYSRLDGNTRAKDRVSIVREFNRSPHTNLCLVSTMAGGLGLNFVGANVVILFDPTWNPANDLQAIDRVYRIGQCRDVTVLRLITLGTVEEIVYLRQVYKQQLQSAVVERQSARRYFEAVQGTGGHQGELFGIQNLFRLQTQGTCLTRRLLEREGRVEAGVTSASTRTGGASVEEEEEEEEEEEAASVPGEPPAGGAPPRHRPWNPTSDRSAGGVLDFSGGSEDEEAGGSVRRKKTAEPGGPSSSSTSDPGASSRLSLLRCGFSRLLQVGGAGPASGVEDSSQSEGESGGGAEGGAEERTAEGAGSRGTEKEKEEEESSRSPGTRLPVGGGAGGEDRGRVGGAGQRSRDRGGGAGARRTEGRSRGLSEARAAPPGRNTPSDSEESEDLGVAWNLSDGEEGCGPRGGKGGTHRSDRRRRSAKARSRHTEHIEEFTSSEEERTPAKQGRWTRVDGSRGPAGAIRTPSMAQAAGPPAPERSSFTSLKRQPRRDGAIDAVLGGVGEVLYTHSNQRVVGASEAEARLSRAAARDVFDRKMYSQFPANHLLETQESQSQDAPESRGPPASDEGNLRVLHPVTFHRQAVRHGRGGTFILGETPPAVRRQQLEHMASRLGMSSARDFAAAVLCSGSGQRLAWLRQYYSALSPPGPDAAAIAAWFPEPPPAPPTDAPPPEPISRTKGSARKAGGESRAREKPPLQPRTPQRPPGRRRGAQTTGSAPAREPAPRVFGEPERTSVSGARAAGGPGSDLDLSDPEPREEAAALDPAVRDAPSSPGLRDGPPSAPAGGKKARLERPQDKSSPPSPPGGASSPRSPRSTLADLIGDTSILDDLFRPSLARGAARRRLPTATPSQTPPRPRLRDDGGASTSHAPSPPPPPRRRAAAGRKDFWDLLNEGSEESLERLTDTSVLERVRGRAHRPAPPPLAGGGASALWKTNDKFLWKK